jgi:hypothetical protein
LSGRKREGGSLLIGQNNRITGDDTQIIGISMQYCDNYGGCTDASVVAVDKGFTKKYVLRNSK